MCDAGVTTYGNSVWSLPPSSPLANSESTYDEHVYIVLTGYPYEGSVISSVHSSETLAEVAMENFKRDSKHCVVTVEKWFVRRK